MTPQTMLLAGLVLGAGIGSISTWLYLMSKYAGRPVDWVSLIGTTVACLVVLGFMQLVA